MKLNEHGIALRVLILAIAIASTAASAAAQAAGSAVSAEAKQRVQALKQSVAANQQKLKQYQWTEVQQLTLKGETKPQQQFMCQYGPNGQVEKYPMGPPQAEDDRQEESRDAGLP